MISALNSKDTVLVSPTAMTNTQTVTANLDCKGADFATIRLALAARLNTNAVAPTISLKESDDTVVTKFTTVTADRTESLANAHELVYHVDVKARKRYLRLSVTTATATNDNVTFSAIATLSRLERALASTSDMVGSTNDAVVIVTPA